MKARTTSGFAQYCFHHRETVTVTSQAISKDLSNESIYEWTNFQTLGVHNLGLSIKDQNTDQNKLIRIN